MKKFCALSLTLLLESGLSNAAEILAEVPDSSGRFGGLSGVMAEGGPIGTVAGAFAGAFGGGSMPVGAARKKTYMVRTDSGAVRRYQTSKYRFAVGEKVQIVRGRVLPLNINS